MPRALLFTIVFIEGFCSLGAEVIALRQIIPHMGSSIVVTAPTIGFFCWRLLSAIRPAPGLIATTLPWWQEIF